MAQDYVHMTAAEIRDRLAKGDKLSVWDFTDRHVIRRVEEPPGLLGFRQYKAVVHAVSVTGGKKTYTLDKERDTLRVAEG